MTGSIMPQQDIEIKVFCAYAQEDEEFFDQLAKHLTILEAERTISVWSDKKITAGEEWEPAIQKNFDAADIILLLISIDFLSSNFYHDMYLERAMTRHGNREACVIPILVRPVEWEKIDLSKLKALPSNNKPITQWAKQEEAFVDISRNIRPAAERERERKKINLQLIQDIDNWVSEVRQQVYEKIERECGKVKILDMEQSIYLEKIYINVNILEKIAANSRRQVPNREESSNLDISDLNSDIKKKTIPALEAASKYSKLMILGKPGAGKTTFLKQVAMRCNSDKFKPHHIPVFITLRDFAESPERLDLLSYIKQQWQHCDVSNFQKAEFLLKEGRVLVLMDGLDEIREEDYRRVRQEIERFTNRFDKGCFIMTCRIAAREDKFEHFSEVEIADFDLKQSILFAQNWFGAKSDSIKAKKFKKILEEGENKRLRELANSPLLLTMLCLVFENEGDFPRNRSELYKEGIDLLLRKWDASRNLERAQAYKRLSLQRKEDLLSRFAHEMFTKNESPFKQEVVEKFIKDFVVNLPDFSLDLHELELDSRAILKSIEAQHGLLVESSRGDYSFSHLTFQEYFTARQIANTCNPYLQEPQNFQELVTHITEKRWREVFLLTVGMVQNADSLIRMMKRKIDCLLEKDKKLQEFLRWVQEKSESVNPNRKPVAVRVLYFIIGRVRIRDLNCEVDCDIEFDSTLASDLKFVKALDPNVNVLFDKEFALDIDLDRALIRAWSLNHIFNYDFNGLNRALNRTLDSSRNLAELKPSVQPLRQKLQELRENLPNKLGTGLPLPGQNRGQDLEPERGWWRRGGAAWTDEVRQAMIDYRNIGHDWQFTEAQKIQLQCYFEANQLLIDCLHSDCYVSRDVRQQVEESLMLPVNPM
jgi:predicted NACHT family NTPase